MQPLPSFEVATPETLDEALEALATPGARLLAGGTDLLPALKRGRERPSRLVSLHGIAALRRIALDEQERQLVVGTGVTLSSLAGDRRVRETFASLAQAASQVGGPQIRRSATLGGNIHLDTRCRYVDQSAFWRGALGHCLKSGGDECRVVAGGRRCVAALSSDCVPALVSLDARIVLRGPDGTRVVPLEQYFRADGLAHVDRRPGELATEVRLPMPEGPRWTRYVKWRPRGSIDFPLVSVALRLDLDADAHVRGARVAAGAVGARPRLVRLGEQVLGRRMGDPELARAVADTAFEQCCPLDNLPYDAGYRRQLIRVLTRRAIEDTDRR